MHSPRATAPTPPRDHTVCTPAGCCKRPVGSAVWEAGRRLPETLDQHACRLVVCDAHDNARLGFAGIPLLGKATILRPQNWMGDERFRDTHSASRVPSHHPTRPPMPTPYLLRVPTERDAPRPDTIAPPS